jgi:hypothetical protein
MLDTPEDFDNIDVQPFDPFNASQPIESAVDSQTSLNDPEKYRANMQEWNQAAESLGLKSPSIGEVDNTTLGAVNDKDAKEIELSYMMGRAKKDLNLPVEVLSMEPSKRKSIEDAYQRSAEEIARLYSLIHDTVGELQRDLNSMTQPSSEQHLSPNFSPLPNLVKISQSKNS